MPSLHRENPPSRETPRVSLRWWQRWATAFQGAPLRIRRYSGRPPSKARRSEYDATRRHQDDRDDRHLPLNRKPIEALHHCEPFPAAAATVDPALWLARSTSTAAERSGINLGSFPSIDTITTKVRSLLENSPPSPMGAS